jgi:hypothetical protein
MRGRKGEEKEGKEPNRELNLVSVLSLGWVVAQPNMSLGWVSIQPSVGALLDWGPTEFTLSSYDFHIPFLVVPWSS